MTADGVVAVRIWRANIGKKIIAHVPVARGRVVEAGSFTLDGVTFPGAEIRLEFLDPGAVVMGLAAGAEAERTEGGWRIAKVVASRSARRLMTGMVHPAPLPGAG